MRKILKIIVFLLIFGTIAYQFRSTLLARVLPLLNNLKDNVSVIFLKPAPCTKPIPYALGTFDLRFNISQQYFLNALSEAETIWEKPLGRELFAYKKDGASGGILKINLVYDYRQQATDKLASLGIAVKNNVSSYETLKAKFLALQKNYEEAKKNFDALLESFNQKQQAYKNEVRFWNKRDGVGEDKYNELEQERLTLNTEAKKLKAMQANINNMVEEINALVVALNRLADTLNISVDKYNTIGASRGESFEEGVYFSDGLNREIDIYEFENRAKLVRVLAHELGHALELEHVNDSLAIMYRLNQDNNETLTASDLSALKTKCGIK